MDKVTPWYLISVDGEPAPQGSKRHVGRGILIESSKKVKPWRQNVAGAATRMGYANLQLEGPVKVIIHFYFDRPKAHYNKTGLREGMPRWITRRPDIDKLIRSTLDAICTDAGMLRDDSQVAVLFAKKAYCDWKRMTPGADISIFHLSTTMEAPDDQLPHYWHSTEVAV